MACDSRGIVYVTDCNNHRVQSFSADGQFMSSFGNKGSQPGQLYHPHGICIDSTDTVYVTDRNHRVSAFSRHGQFLVNKRVKRKSLILKECNGQHY